MRCGRVLWSLIFLLLCSNELNAQPPQYVFRVSFFDKTGAPDISNPSLFLSTRALDRRTTQGITVDSTDRPVSPDYIDSVLTLTGGKFHLASKWFNHCVVLLEDSADILNLANKPYIKSIKYIAYYNVGLHKSGYIVNPKNANEKKGAFKKTGTPAYYGDAYTQTAIVNGDYLHNQGYTGAGKMIVVLDEAFRGINTGRGFDSMNQQGRLIDRHDFVDANDVLNEMTDHGSACLSQIAGNIPDTFVGTAPGATYAAYCTEIILTEQELEWDNMVAGIERADSVGADIISSSLGYNEFNMPVYYKLPFSQLDGKTLMPVVAANMATSKGMLFVTSAGNEGGNSWNKILTPGDADSVLTVGSVSSARIVAFSSGWGPNAAGRIKPDVCMLGDPATYLNDGNDVTGSSATSFAVPQLAGWAACLWQAAKPGTRPYDIRMAIIQSADRYKNPDSHGGYGVPNFKKALEYLGVKDVVKVPVAAGWLWGYPNPAAHQFNLRIVADDTQEVSISITDLSGKVVFGSTQKLNKGEQTILIATSSFASGMYFVKAATETKTQVIKMLKD